MARLPAVTGRDLIRFLESHGFSAVRQRGSHVRLRHPDGRVTTVPFHGNRRLPVGLLRKIVRDDLEMERSDFVDGWASFHGGRRE